MLLILCAHNFLNCLLNFNTNITNIDTFWYFENNAIKWTWQYRSYIYMDSCFIRLRWWFWKSSMLIVLFMSFVCWDYLVNWSCSANSCDCQGLGL
ncbi:hypothetical protein KSF78_0001448 [Schistosoma japonicum]|nr:hypothetical protein KSF78_0001448 [Schistosoma japonicum]KAH8853652.1 hypothetical protein KSF78_0001448 [Schistosoma japonicum]